MKSHSSAQWRAEASIEMEAQTSEGLSTAGVKEIPGFPSIELKIFYTAHATKDDITNLSREFDETDIYIPELSGFSERDRDLFQDLSKGYVSPEYMLRRFEIDESRRMYGFWRSHLEMIYNSQKPLGFVDVEKESDINNRKSEAYDKRYIAQRFTRDFNAVLQRTKNYIITAGNVMGEREEYIVEQVGPRVSEIIAANPSLSQKDKVKALLQLGTLHTGVSHALRKNGEQVSSVFSQLPYYDYENEAIRKVRFQKIVEPEFTARVALQLFTEDKLMKHLFYLTQDSWKVLRMQRMLVSQFTYREIQSMFKTANSSEDIYTSFITQLEQKGKTLPKTEAEMDKIIEEADLRLRRRKAAFLL